MSSFVVSGSLPGITNDSKDLGIDTLRTVTLPLLKKFGVPTEDLELKILRRGAPPLGGGEVLLKVPQMHSLQVRIWGSSITFRVYFRRQWQKQL